MEINLEICFAEHNLETIMKRALFVLLCILLILVHDR